MGPLLHKWHRDAAPQVLGADLTDDAITAAILADAAGAVPTADCIASIDAASWCPDMLVGASFAVRPSKRSARDYLNNPSVGQLIRPHFESRR